VERRRWSALNKLMLMPLVYDAQPRPPLHGPRGAGHNTLQTTALVNEAYGISSWRHIRGPALSGLYFVQDLPRLVQVFIRRHHIFLLGEFRFVMTSIEPVAAELSKGRLVRAQVRRGANPRPPAQMAGKALRQGW
jgi:hypothetical protein